MQKTEQWEKEKGRADKATSELKREVSDNERLTGMNKALVAALEQIKKAMGPIEQVLSCLSCLEFLKEQPMTLVCGHSICKTVSTTPLKNW